MINFFQKKKKAFTLIELLVVVAIIGVLATLAVVALQNARKSARDAKRVADVKQMQVALELYFNDNGSYPTSVTSTIASSGQFYMASVPTAPTPADGSCSTTTNAYTYSSDGSTYTINFCLGGQISGLSSGRKVATRDGVNDRSWVCGEALIDSRDSQEYSTILFGSQCWMAKNINYNDGCSSNSLVGNSDTRWCGCYSNNTSNCTTYGRLYQWSAAMAGSNTAGAQGICPSGWHVPTSAEFTTLFNTINSDINYKCDGTSFKIGKAIAASSGWATNTNVCAVGNNQQTNNSTGFNALPTGYLTELFSFYGMSYNAIFWSSSFASSKASTQNLSYDNAGFYSFTYSPFYAFPVRCLKN